MAQPHSFVMCAAESMTAPGSARQIAEITEADAPGLAAEKHNVLGILQMRQENYNAAASHFLKAIEAKPSDAVAYINLGNVYYRQGLHEKALEGYRKAEQLAPRDPVGQYNLAQAYIKTLLLAESSTALKSAAANGIERVKASYTSEALDHAPVYTATFSNRRLWGIAAIEGSSSTTAVVSDGLRPIARFGLRTSAALMILALVIAIVIRRLIHPKHLAFQCSNCGDLTSEANCNGERGTFICGPCAERIANVSSDKVIDALLRQRRQKVLVQRRRAIRFMTVWIPGVRDIFYGRLARGVTLATIFSISLLQIWARGYLIEDWNSLLYPTPPWKWILPAAGIVISYAMSVFARRYKEVRNYRTPSFRRKMADAEPIAAGGLGA
jgi:hypothetical protein